MKVGGKEVQRMNEDVDVVVGDSEKEISGSVLWWSLSSSFVVEKKVV